METPSLCKKHFSQVGNYFDKGLALEFELDEHHCLVCSRVITVEGARRFVEQNKRPHGNLTPRHSTS